MGKTYLKIRGIYTTALTRLTLDMEYGIAQPSHEIRERFQIPEQEGTGDMSIIDRDDKQGVRVAGKRALVEELIDRLWRILIDMVVRRELAHDDRNSIREEEVAFDLEFPGAAKAVLDHLRGRVLPTLTNHHRLRIISSHYVDLLEGNIEKAPHRGADVERELMDRLVFQPLRKYEVVRIEHVKPDGTVLNLREGEIVLLEEDTLILKRHFQQGRYDGLDFPIEPGDYGITEVKANAWFLRHRYFAKGGTLKGEYGNVNTPVEFYPDRIRYVDLHVDVVRKGKDAPKIIDQEELESITTNGLISDGLKEKALEVSHQLLEQMRCSDS
ncbi:MAG: DUF402 domain-containing protein [Proteobacteria bacterium]|nr:DUF402 domain-containing protein [Pseudomonadota bacterium]